MKPENKFEFKHLEAFPHELMAVDPFVAIVFYWFVAYAKSNGLPVCVTRIFQYVEGATGVHPDGRGIDISSRGWPDLHIARVVSKLNKLFPQWGTSPDGKNLRVIIHHKTEDGVYHFHLQVRRGLKLED